MIAVLDKNKEEFDDALENLKAYLETTKGKTSDNQQVFALIDDIQKEKAARGDSMSDAEIQALAAAQEKAQREKPEAKVAKRDTEVAPKSIPVQATRPVETKVEEPAAKAVSAPVDSSSTNTGNDDDISDLEKALKN